MTRHLALFALAYTAAVLQSSAVSSLSETAVTPNLLLLAGASAPLLLPGWSAVLWAAGCGLLLDCLGPGKLGIDMFCAAAVVFVVQRQLRERPVESAPATVLVCFLSIAAMRLLSLALRHVIEHPIDGETGPVLVQAAAVAAWSALLGGAAIITWRVLRAGLGFAPR